jgi:hypothetical protein
MFWIFIFTIHAESDAKTSLDDTETFMMPFQWFSSRLIQLQIDNGQANQDLNLSTYQQWSMVAEMAHLLSTLPLM